MPAKGNQPHITESRNPPIMKSCRTRKKSKHARYSMLRHLQQNVRVPAFGNTYPPFLLETNFFNSGRGAASGQLVSRLTHHLRLSQTTSRVTVWRASEIKSVREKFANAVPKPKTLGKRIAETIRQSHAVEF